MGRADGAPNHTYLRDFTMSENTTRDPGKAELPDYDKAREAGFAFLAELEQLGWACHIAYDGHFFLEKKHGTIGR